MTRLDRTEREVLAAAMEGPTITTCGALLLLTIKFHRSGKHNKSFNFLGLVRCIHLLRPTPAATIVAAGSAGQR